jgi:hypothetical protein
MKTKRIFCKVFLEGLQVEFNSIHIQEQAGEPPQATISFPAESAALTILPKTVTHVFYMDDNNNSVLIFQGELAGSGISFTSDKRSIQLTFTGMTQNWKTNVILPMDLKVRTMASSGLYAQIVQNPDPTASSEVLADLIQFKNITGTHPLDDVLKRLTPTVGDPDTLSEILVDVLKLFGTDYNGVYWNAVSTAFKFDNMIAIDGLGKETWTPIKKIEKLLVTRAVMDYIRGQAQGTPAGVTIDRLLLLLLDAFGFCWSEIAAPSYVGGKRAHILIKPKTHFFPPMKHNLVVDDNIVQLNFTRSFDEEPTRLLGQTVPFYLSADELNTTIIGVVVPNNVRLLDAIPKNVEGAEYETLKMFGLSKEEQCRGVIVHEYQDDSFIENAYLVAINTDPATGQVNMATNMTIADRIAAAKKFAGEVQDPPNLSAMQNTEIYHMNIASTMYYDKRHAERTVQVNSPYSPYRMVDFPGVIISKYFPTGIAGLVGNLQSVSATISADGEAEQTLLFSHCRFVRTSKTDPDAPPESSYGFLDDDMSEPIPWYADYVDQEHINKFYEQFTGDPQSAVMTGGSVARAINAIKKALPNDNEATTLKRTSRPLVPESVIRGIFPNPFKHPESVRKLGADRVTTMEAKPFVKERIDRVVKVFDIVS